MDQHSFANDFTVDYNKDFVKDKLNQIFDTKAFQLRETNELLNTWRFNGVFAMTKAYGSTIQINPIDNDKTNIKIQTYNLQGGHLDTGLLSQAQSEFLKVLTNALQGEEVTYENVNKGKAGCLGSIIFMFAILVLLTILFNTL